MKNLVKLFGLSIVLSGISISAFADNLAKNYVESENIIISEGQIYLHTEGGSIETLGALFSDEKGLYILEEQKASMQNAEDMYTFREPTAGYECINGHINPRYRKVCQECGQPVIY